MFKTIQRTEQKAQVTLCPGREVRGSRMSPESASAWPGTGSDSRGGRRRAPGTGLDQHSPTHVTALSQFVEAKVRNK